MRGPGGFEGGKVCDALVSQVDIFPTICRLCGIEPPEWLQGRSIMPLITGEKEEINDHIFSEINFHGGYDPTRAVRTKRFKYIRHFETPAFPARTSNQRGGLTLNYWLDKGWREKQFPDEELYDLTFDPNENNNLAESSEAQSMLDSMRSRLDRFMKWTDDPLLSGQVPAPKGASVYDVDANLLSGPGIKP